ncbi:PucR family transcriptional regulator [Gordonia rhizosphera]|uniref:PucR C-terminal helix-turn-helix domain-containing protein n=1 Tax=Gordonia rhizosphera NBRC 16068 TaxID=1108045 RepID=K6V0T8_9ACTN|nr:PucR family transcriptional regulator [Gordonia rhizosphera]GAB89493.1 hypothetical protein GORHZ_062_00700 [Gordonia rhizosphera NBRC 16068]
MTTPGGVTLGRLLLALDRTVATLLTAPRGLDQRVSSAALLDLDDIHLGLGRAARGAELFLFVGVPDDAVLTWLSGLGTHVPVAILCKAPTDAVIGRAESVGVAVVGVDPHARWERIYHLVTRVLDAAGIGEATPGEESMRSGVTGDLFELAAEIARQTNGLVSIEDERSHVLAYSSAGDEADELRRLSILGREGPPEMMAWLRQWGVMDVLRTSAAEVVTVDERADLGLRPRRAVAIRSPRSVGPGEFLGTIWLQQGPSDFSDDTDEVLVGAAAVAARMISRRRDAGSGHADLVRRLLGVWGEVVDAEHLGAELGITAGAPVVVVGFATPIDSEPEVAGVVSAVTLHASAFSPLSVTTTIRSRIYVVAPTVTVDATVAWAESASAAVYRHFGVRLRAVVGGPAVGLAAVPTVRTQIDRVLDAAANESELIADVTTVADSQTGVLLGEIVAHLAANPDLVDSRVVELADLDERTGSDFSMSLRAYLDHFGDVRSAARALHVHPNTLRYRIRRLQALTGMDLDDPATRLVVALSLRTR